MVIASFVYFDNDLGMICPITRLGRAQVPDSHEYFRVDPSTCKASLSLCYPDWTRTSYNVEPCLRYLIIHVINTCCSGYHVRWRHIKVSAVWGPGQAHSAHFDASALAYLTPCHSLIDGFATRNPNIRIPSCSSC